MYYNVLQIDQKSADHSIRKERIEVQHKDWLQRSNEKESVRAKITRVLKHTEYRIAPEVQQSLNNKTLIFSSKAEVRKGVPRRLQELRNRLRNKLSLNRIANLKRPHY